MAATTTIPIVGIGTYPAGAYAILARPGGNITGIEGSLGGDFYAKHVQLLHDAVPTASRIAWLGTRAVWDDGEAGRGARLGAEQLGLPLVPVIVDYPVNGATIRQAFDSMARQTFDALYVSGSGGVYAHRRLIAEKPEREKLLRDNGADQVFIDTGEIADQVREVFPCGVNKVLELVGTTTLVDSLRSTKAKGIVCMTGMVGYQWSFEEFSPMGAIPTAVSLTTYAGGADDFIRTPLQELVQQIEKGSLRPKVGRTFSLDQIVEAHRCMEENRAGGKIVVLT